MINQFGIVNEETTLTGADSIFPLFSQFGVTTVYDAGFAQFESFSYPALDKLARSGRLPFRVVSSHMIQSPDHVAGAIEKIKSFLVFFRRSAGKGIGG